MMLSSHFSLAEMIASDTALRHGINNAPGPHEIDNLKRLCALVLEPLRAAIGQPIRITSGYRSSLLNTLVGGSRTSDHCAGRAADIQVPGTSPLSLARAIESLDLPVQQVIHEFGGDARILKVRLDELGVLLVVLLNPGLLGEDWRRKAES